MWRNMAAWIVLGTLTGLAGCGNPSAPATDASQASGAAQSNAPADDDTPEGAVTIFLSAVCAGNDEHAASMLTELARRKTAEMDLEVAPSGSDTARFQIGEVEFVGDDGARVACTWSDLDEQGGRAEEHILWVLRREAAGWRIAGMAPSIFPDEPPLLLNFEDPEEMFEKLQRVQQEVMRRAQAEAMPRGDVSREAQRQGPPGDAIRR